MLEHLDLSNNKIATQDCFKSLVGFAKLRVFIMMGTPLADELADRFKPELLIAVGTELKNLKTLNEDEVADEDYSAANDERNERAKAKKEAEEEAARVAAEEAAAAAEKAA